MNIHCCSFASESFEKKQKLQANHLLKIGFDSNKIHLFNPKKLNRNFYELQPNASEDNKYGWFTFKPFMILSILEEIDQGDILLYLDVNDKPLYGIKSYLEKFFVENNAIDILGIMGNYPNINFLSRFHRSNLSNELLLSSLFNFQPEAGVISVKNSPKAKSLLFSWYYLTLNQAYDLDKFLDRRSRHDQETLFLLSRIYKTIRLESWFLYKLTGNGLRKYIDFEYFRRNI